MKFVLASLAALLVSSPTAAQTSSCGMEWGRWVCRQQPSYGDPLDGVQKGQAFVNGLFAQRRAREAAAQQSVAADQSSAAGDRRESLLREVGGLVAAGKCTEAKKIALSRGDFDLAERTQRLCSPN